ncbi:MAG: AraC family transcriptional regulator [bacterium]|nr:AraC family transcriptional regulator [bacterium]
MQLEAKNFFGTERKNRELSNYFLNITHYEAGEELPSHYHDLPYLSTPIKGKYLERINSKSKEEEIDYSNILVRPGGYQHSNKFWSSHSICFNLEFKKNNKSEELGFNPEQFTSLRQNAHFHKIIHGFIHGFHNDELETLIEEYLSSYSSVLNTTKSSVVSKATDYIHENYKKELSLKLIAKELNVHPVYLARCFKQKLHTTIGEYIRNVRVSESLSQLMSSEKSLTQIAFDAGFFDQSHFIKTYRNYFQNNPNLTRKLARLI